MELLPDSVDIRDRYKLLIGSVVPRPIAFVSTISPAGAHNLAPYSFFTAVGSNPMTLLFCPATKPDGSDKDTLRNCLPPEEGGVCEFWSTWLRDLCAKGGCRGRDAPYGESEFDLTGLTPLPSSKVRPPRLAQSPVAFECETVQILRTAPDRPASGNVVMGRVVYIHVDDVLINDRFHIDADRLEAIGRMGGLEYCRTRDRFEMPRGREALKARRRAPGAG